MREPPVGQVSGAGAQGAAIVQVGSESLAVVAEAAALLGLGVAVAAAATDGVVGVARTAAAGGLRAEADLG